MQADYPLKLLCQTFEVSRSGYYAWQGRGPSARQQADAQLSQQIQSIHAQSRHSYGSPRVHHQLQHAGVSCSRKRVARLMRQHHLAGRKPRRFVPRTTDSRHDEPIAPNRLADLWVERPNQAWAVDITYVHTTEGWLYLAGVLDLCSRRLIGWSFDDTLATSLPAGALRMALTQRRPPPGLIHHSDRGSQYASGDYRRALQAAQLTASMSRRACCYDNATMESFWSTLKSELVYRCEFATRAQAQQIIFEWIEVFYNRTRLHSALGYKSPVDFENQLN